MRKLALLIISMGLLGGCSRAWWAKQAGMNTAPTEYQVPKITSNASSIQLELDRIKTESETAVKEGRAVPYTPPKIVQTKAYEKF